MKSTDIISFSFILPNLDNSGKTRWLNGIISASRAKSLQFVSHYRLHKSISIEVFSFCHGGETTIIIFQKLLLWRHDSQHDDTKNSDIQHNDTRHNDTPHNDTQHDDTQHNDTQHNDTQHNDTQHYDIQHDNEKLVTQHNDIQHYDARHNVIEHNDTEHIDI
jgi:hypothetical protein